MSDRDLCLRVDHVSDVVFLPDNNVRVPPGWRRALRTGNATAGAWRKRGNRYIYDTKPYAAIECYNWALDSSPTVDETHATFVRPVSIKPSGSRGHGHFTTEAVKTGDLLLCEKAFAHAFVKNRNADNNRDLSVLINTETNSIRMGAQADLVTMVVQKLRRNPSLIPTITDLHHGAYKPVECSEVDGMPVVDT
ncbi:hypothetical protein EDB81DRAFT_888251 [Dactylonectria macrodidyma]|uniref:Uncharacterized protein n=1 Tax=Dactylonectria macrodidyma TaxID=307937 RepID=A0A9P9IRV2_9HYPO|nr:hypothetical protein EDB81DRAFT_888251 [Dactylonectria macrodidyma]